MMKKSFYEAPEAELLLVKFEKNIMSQLGVNNNNKTEYIYRDGSDEDVDIL